MLNIVTEVNGKQLKIKFEGPEKLKELVEDNVLFVDYTRSIENVPENILNIVGVTSVLPLAMANEWDISVSCLDYNFIESVRKTMLGYKNMWPKLSTINILVSEEIELPTQNFKNEAALYSGGIDAWATFAEHNETLNHLYTVHGADVHTENFENWRMIENSMRKMALKNNLSLDVIRSNFKEMFNTPQMSEFFYEKFADGYWHGFQHGPALVGLTAPLCYLDDINLLYIASSHTKNLHAKLGSSPELEGVLELGKTHVSHDLYNHSRQDKINMLVSKIKKHELDDVEFRVCWEGNSESNCGTCEKCARTIGGLLASGIAPESVGFKSIDYGQISKALKKYELPISHFVATVEWGEIQQNLLNMKCENSFVYQINKTDFDSYASHRNSFFRRLKRYLIRKVG